jgi:glycosyltransferase involved in cell wall biosynthesis
MPALITCVIPVRDGERFLGAAIDSVLAQDHRPLDVVVVDDGSTDRSAAIAEAYGGTVRLIRRTESGGPGAARNTGVREARGDYLAFCDADDLFRPTKLSQQLRELEAHPEAGLCLCTVENFWEPGLEAEREQYTRLGKLRGTHVFMTLLVRRAAFDRVGWIDETRPVAEDVDWFMRASDLGVVERVIPDVLVDRRMHPASLTHTVDTVDPLFEFIAARVRERKSR